MTFIVDCQMRLDRFLADNLTEFSRSKLAQHILDGHVLVDGRARKPSFMLEEGMLVELTTNFELSRVHILAPADVPLDIRYEDEHLIVVNKPRGLATHPAPGLKGPSLVNALIGRATTLSSGSAAFRPGIVHRLDKETTGLLVVAKDDRSHALLAAAISKRLVDRRYLAIAEGVVPRERFVIDAPIARNPRKRDRMAAVEGGKPATSEVVRLDQLEAGSLLCLRLSTGRTHQIRVHLSAVGHPVVGDTLYGAQTGPALQLHSAQLGFSHPQSGKWLEIECEPPGDFLWRAYDATAVRGAFDSLESQSSR